MSKAIRRVAVLGSGVMGSGIAAHMANAGFEVLLLDIAPKDPKAPRNGVAAAALAGLAKSKPAAFFHPSNAKLVSVGNLDDDLAKAGACDLIVEAIVERLDIKRGLFEKLEKVVQEHTIVASNTSGLRIHDMVEGRTESFKKRFLVMHFFNPVRYMKLLELVAGPDTDPATVTTIATLGKEQLGKGIVLGKDTPNFVGNRIGAHSMMATIHLMLETGLQPEDVDNITGTPMGHPKSASFRTADLVGLDTFVHVADNCFKSLEGDEDRAVFEVPPYIRSMVEKGILGDKTKGGFYKRDKGETLTLDPATLTYRPKGGDADIAAATKAISKIEDPAERVRQLVATRGKVGKFAWKTLSRGLAYAARRIGEITDDVVAVDDAMKWGYNWELGPFETWDALGFKKTLVKMRKDGIAIPPRIDEMESKGARSFYKQTKKGLAVWSFAEGKHMLRPSDPREMPLSKVRRGEAAVLSNAGAEAWDLGDGVLGVTFKTKANSIDPDVIAMLHDAAAKAETDFRAIVIANEGEHFCVGANLFGVVMAAGAGQWDQLRTMVKGYQSATQRLKYARVPVVAAPYGMTLGGGLELCFASDATQAAAETYAGLVEVGVGIIPGGAGTMNMLWRALDGNVQGANVDAYAIVTQVFKNIALANVATSAVEAQQFGYFKKSDGVSFDRARQLYEAKQRAIGLAQSGYHPPIPRAWALPGENGIATLGMMIDTLVAGGYASAHDALIARKLAVVLCGGASGHTHEVTEQEVLDLECEAFISLCGEPKSQERMQFMLMNNRPLRN
jgi:3-hydroxyacyl-CoA dehydrogenase